MGLRRAIVLLSGGLDSATVLAIARSQNYQCYALSVDYGQRHRAELQAAQRIMNIEPCESIWPASAARR
jgi:7-cyano-7-deazaguanine synthase